MGGSVDAIEEGFIQDEIARSAYQYQQQIESNSKIIVGLNKFTSNQEEKIPGFKIDESIQKMQVDKLKALKAKRNNEQASICLDALSKAAKENQNIMPFVIDAVESYCTLGEIADTLRKIYGEYK
jgi:methylmalonyl-CoA mutase N-terminal domain/subunit